jgi:hypothetical protein
MPGSGVNRGAEEQKPAQVPAAYSGTTHTQRAPIVQARALAAIAVLLLAGGLGVLLLCVLALALTPEWVDPSSPGLSIIKPVREAKIPAFPVIAEPKPDANPPARVPADAQGRPRVLRPLMPLAAGMVPGVAVVWMHIPVAALPHPEQGQAEDGFPVANAGAPALGKENFGTAVAFAASPQAAARIAKTEGKLTFLLHVSGHFEDSQFT